MYLHAFVYDKNTIENVEILEFCNAKSTCISIIPIENLVSRSQTHPTASEGKGLGTCNTTTCSSVLSSDSCLHKHWLLLNNIHNY